MSFGPNHRKTTVHRLNSTFKPRKLKILTTLIVCLTLFTSKTFSQKVDSIDSITLEGIKKIDYNKNYKNIIALKKYKDSRGNWIKIGDTLEIGKPSNANNLSSGFIETQAINNHSYIILGTGAAALTGSVIMANQSMTGNKGFIIDIQLARGSKKQNYEISVSLNRVGGGRFGSVKKLARVWYEKALESGEIINLKAGLTREEAISKLKEAKELLDLEMMTQEEYNAIKTELTPIITNKM